MPKKLPSDFVAPKRRKTGPMSVHYRLLAGDLDSWYSFTRAEVGHCEAASKSNLHSGAHSRGLLAHARVDPDVMGGVLACYYEADDD